MSVLGSLYSSGTDRNLLPNYSITLHYKDFSKELIIYRLYTHTRGMWSLVHIMAFEHTT